MAADRRQAARRQPWRHGMRLRVVLENGGRLMYGAFELTEARRVGLTAHLDHGAERGRSARLDVSPDTWPSQVAQMPGSSGPDARSAGLFGPPPDDEETDVDEDGEA